MFTEAVAAVGLKLFFMAVLLVSALIAPIGVYIRRTRSKTGSLVVAVGISITLIVSFITCLCLASEDAMQFFTGTGLSEALK